MEDLEFLCRICLDNIFIKQVNSTLLNDTISVLSRNSCSSEEVKLSEIISYSVGIQMPKYYGASNSICDICLVNIRTCYSLKRQCEIAQRKFINCPVLEDDPLHVLPKLEREIEDLLDEKDATSTHHIQINNRMFQAPIDRNIPVTETTTQNEAPSSSRLIKRKILLTKDEYEKFLLDKSAPIILNKTLGLGLRPLPTQETPVTNINNKSSKENLVQEKETTSMVTLKKISKNNNAKLGKVQKVAKNGRREVKKNVITTEMCVLRPRVLIRPSPSQRATERTSISGDYCKIQRLITRISNKPIKQKSKATIIENLVQKKKQITEAVKKKLVQEKETSSMVTAKKIQRLKTRKSNTSKPINIETSKAKIKEKEPIDENVSPTDAEAETKGKKIKMQAENEKLLLQKKENTISNCLLLRINDTLKMVPIQKTEVKTTKTECSEENLVQKADSTKIDTQTTITSDNKDKLLEIVQTKAQTTNIISKNKVKVQKLALQKETNVTNNHVTSKSLAKENLKSSITELDQTAENNDFGIITFPSNLTNVEENNLNTTIIENRAISIEETNTVKKEMHISSGIVSEANTPPATNIQAENPFHLCYICGVTVKQIGPHLAIHVNKLNLHNKKYKCVQCKKGFHTKRRLVIHTRGVHERNFMCDNCGRKFGTTEHLRVHMRQHTGEHPYKCTLCDSSFKQNVLLRRHMTYSHNAAK